MLIEKDGSGKGKTLFQCDRCKKYLGRENRYGIYVKKDKLSPKKTHDLCARCFRAFCRGIKKGV